MPPIEWPSVGSAGPLPFPFTPGRRDHRLDPLADKRGANGYYEAVIPGAEECAGPEPVITVEFTGGDAHTEETGVGETAEAEAKTASKYRLGGVAVEAAGVERADALPGEEKTQGRYRMFLGGVAMHQSIEAGAVPETVHRSSLDLLRDAAAGDQASWDALLVDAKTHVYEIMGGVGESMEVELQLDVQGRVVWAGQTTEARQFHTLTAYTYSAEMLAVRHAEGIGSFRLEDRNREGLLGGKAVFDFSAMAEASHAELSKAGMFLNSIAVCIRRNSFAGANPKLKSVFVAGVDQRQFGPKAGETEAQEIARQEAALENRFDIKVLRRLFGLFGVEGAETMSPAELLATQLVTPDTIDEIDMVMLYDQLAAEEMADGSMTFFGSAELWKENGSPAVLTRAHYEAHAARRAERQAEYNGLCQRIVREQVRRHAEATSPIEAIDLKRRVVLDMSVERAARDNQVDSSRFGRVAAELIDQAREQYAKGDDSGGDKLIDQAKEEAVDSSCPPGERNKLKANDSEERDSKDCNEVKDGDHVHCPYCDQNVTAIVRGRDNRIYCSNRRCSAAYNKETVSEKIFNGPKAPLFVSTPTAKAKNTKQPAGAKPTPKAAKKND
jgi:hypothetical protein